MKRLIKNPTLLWTLRGLGVLGLAWLAAQIVPPRGAVPGRNPFRAPSPGRPLVIAHGGGLGLNPENTSGAFAASAALGCDMLEMDARLTKDGALVTHHDATVDRTSNGSGAVIDHTLAELKALNFGYHFRDASGARPYRLSRPFASPAAANRGPNSPGYRPVTTRRITLAVPQRQPGWSF